MTHRRKHRPPTTKQEARQTRTEMVNAERGDYDKGYVTMPITVETAPATPPQKWFVIDTNLILSCVDILYDPDDEDWREPLNFQPDLHHAHIIIPSIVYEELNHIKDEPSNRGMIARIAFERLSKFFANSGRSLEQLIRLEAPIETGWEDQTISLLPLPKDFHKYLPWTPDCNDNDGWIAVTALAATMIHEGIDVQQKIDVEKIMKMSNRNKDVTLLTNDKSLLGKADLYGVRVGNYSFEKRPVYTGCRNITVPAEMFEKFFHEERLTREEFEEYMPDELPLIANEFLIMAPEDDKYPRSYFAVGAPFVNIGRYHKENDTIYPLRFMKREGKTPPNACIACYYDALNDDKVKFISVRGDAGTGKTYTAIIHAINAVRAGLYRKIIVIPSQSSKNNLGALPGSEAQKMEPLVAFCKEAIESYLASTPEFRKKREELRRYGDLDRSATDEYSSEKPKYFGDNDYMVEELSDFTEKAMKESKPYYPGKSEKKKKELADSNETKLTYNQLLKKQVDYIYERYFNSFPYEQVMGRSFEDAFIILDEFQRIQIDDADTLVSRPAKGSKLVVLGDTNQIHDSSLEKQFKNGLNYAQMLFFDWEGAACIELTDNLRGDIPRVMNENRRKVRRRMGFI